MLWGARQVMCGTAVRPLLCSVGQCSCANGKAMSIRAAGFLPCSSDAVGSPPSDGRDCGSGRCLVALVCSRKQCRCLNCTVTSICAAGFLPPMYLMFHSCVNFKVMCKCAADFLPPMYPMITANKPCMANSSGSGCAGLDVIGSADLAVIRFDVCQHCVKSFCSHWQV